MSSFWTLSTGENLEAKDSYDSDAFVLIPDGTECVAFIENSEWVDFEGDEYISNTWAVVSPKEYANTRIFQKIRVLDKEIKKRDKAVTMLTVIDNIASNGALLRSGKQPTDRDLQKTICNKRMAVKTRIWEMNDKKGNWISGVAKINAVKQEDDDDDIPW